MVHVGFDEPTLIGEFCSITHHATVHGCVIEDRCLVGVGAVSMDGARTSVAQPRPEVPPIPSKSSSTDASMAARQPLSESNPFAQETRAPAAP